MLGLIRATPGKKAEPYEAEAKLDKAKFSKVLAKLREEGKVKTEGARRATTYRVA